MSSSAHQSAINAFILAKINANHAVIGLAVIIHINRWFRKIFRRFGYTEQYVYKSVIYEF